MLFSNSALSRFILRQIPVTIALFVCIAFTASLSAATGGSISGTVLDPSGAVVAGATLTLVNTAQNDHLQSRSRMLRDSILFQTSRWPTTI